MGRGVGPDALGAINIAMPFVLFMGALCTLMTVGGITITAIRLGRGDEKGANDAFRHAALLASLVAALLMAAGLGFPRQMAALMGANGTFLDMTADYIFYYSAFSLPVACAFILQGFVRNDGSPGLVGAAVVAGAPHRVYRIKNIPHRDKFRYFHSGGRECEAEFFSHRGGQSGGRFSTSSAASGITETDRSGCRDSGGRTVRRQRHISVLSNFRACKSQIAIHNVPPGGKNGTYAHSQTSHHPQFLQRFRHDGSAFKRNKIPFVLAPGQKRRRAAVRATPEIGPERAHRGFKKFDIRKKIQIGLAKRSEKSYHLFGMRTPFLFWG
ncbi:MAG: hypothetical protein LBP73_08380 [Clostridiales Family XIII bacterium]|nr:hypothetical protein [Clostridiales Family XIII bacterium]